MARQPGPSAESPPTARSRRPAWLLLVAAVVMAAVAGLAIARGFGDPSERKPVVRSCADRVESQPIKPRPSRDTVIGPIAFYRLAEKFDPDARRGPADLNAPPLKALTIVTAGRTVEVTVPGDQRAWMRLFYERSAYSGAEGDHSVTFRGCPQLEDPSARRRECGSITTACEAGYTQFAGEIYVDYGAAPDQGRCARISVRADGQRRASSALLFPPHRKECGS